MLYYFHMIRTEISTHILLHYTWFSNQFSTYTLFYFLIYLYPFLFSDFQRWRVMTQTNTKSKSEKFPPPHQDGAVGYPQETSHKGPLSFGPTDASFGSAVFNSRSSESVKSMGTAAGGPSSRRKTNREDPRMAPSRRFIRGFKPSSVGMSTNLFFKSK